MTRFLQFVSSLKRRDEAQDLLEYSLLVALIALVAVGAVTAPAARSTPSSATSLPRSRQRLATDTPGSAGSLVG